MKKNFKENTKRLSLGNVVAIILCGVLAASALLAGVGFMSKGFTNTDVGSWFERELNADNLIKKEDYNDKLPSELDNGLKINWKDDGSIVLSGKVDDKSIDAEQDPAPVAFTSVTLQGGKVYNITPDNKSCTKDGFGLMISYVDANGINVTNQKVDGDGAVIDLSAKNGSTNVTISFYYENDVTYFGITSYIRPVLVEDGSVSSFYN